MALGTFHPASTPRLRVVPAKLRIAASGGGLLRNQIPGTPHPYPVLIWPINSRQPYPPGRLASQSSFDLLLWLMPSLQARPPAANVPTIRLVVITKFPAERRFFIQDYEQMHAKSNCCDGGNRE